MAASTRVTEVLSLSEGGLTEPWSGPAPEIAGYHIEGLLAQGGQAEVYGATRLADGLGVVIKVLRSRADAPSYAVTTFRREVELLASLKHPNVAALLDHGEQPGAHWFAMERCDGGSLAERCVTRGALPDDEAARVMEALLTGLAYTHARGVVHRDVKPDNVLFADGERVVLGDFGIAKRFEKAGLSGVSTVQTVVGTAAWMPREQREGSRDVRPSADVWSAAATYLYMLSGEAPDTQRTGAPAHVAAVIARALDEDPARRYADAIAFRSAWRAAIGAR
jgi:serine/threonine protein kinase